VRLALPSVDEDAPDGELDYRRQAAISHRPD
jgi:hypothetical protein